MTQHKKNTPKRELYRDNLIMFILQICPPLKNMSS